MKLSYLTQTSEKIETFLNQKKRIVLLFFLNLLLLFFLLLLQLILPLLFQLLFQSPLMVYQLNFLLQKFLLQHSILHLILMLLDKFDLEMVLLFNQLYMMKLLIYVYYLKWSQIADIKI